ncbi:MAG: hypothetical protein K1060chlam5_01265 [Candidatus Anoxychlamydiales bacterium]|nr:hypothetical protein [Candidatus Anoxychlamydiales bacterium]
MITQLIIYLLLAVFSGFLAGLLGIGGGIILVPALYLMFQNIPFINQPMHIAIGTSLAIITIASLESSYLYQKRTAIYWPIIKKFFPSLILGAIIGSLASYFIKDKILLYIFAIIAFIIGLYLLLLKKRILSHKNLKKFEIFICSFVIGFLATMLGVGGGLIALPIFFLFIKIPSYSLVGTSSVLTFLTSIVGMFSYVFMGYDKINKYSLGYVFLPAFIIISIFSIFFVYLGIKIEDKINTKNLKKIFAVVLIATSLFLIFQ